MNFSKNFKLLKKGNDWWALNWPYEVIIVIESLLQCLHLSSAMGLSSTFFEIWKNSKKCMRKSRNLFWKFPKSLSQTDIHDLSIYVTSGCIKMSVMIQIFHSNLAIVDFVKRPLKWQKSVRLCPNFFIGGRGS